MGSNKNALKRSEVADAAEACFRKYGVHRTSMSDVAEALGVTRQTIYRLFENRTELLEYVAGRRIAELGVQLKGAFSAYTSLREALVDGSLRSIEAGNDDELLSEIFRHSDDHGFEQFLFRGSPKIRAVMIDLWGDLIDQARRNGELRPGLTNDDLIEWVRNIHALATIRDDYGRATRRRLLETFLVPSVLLDHARLA